VDNYWIRTVANGGTAGFDNGINSAILRYVGANETDPTTNATTATAALVETDLHPLVATAVPGTAVAGGADVTMNIVISLDFTTFTFEINGVVRCFFLLLNPRCSWVFHPVFYSPDRACVTPDLERRPIRDGSPSVGQRLYAPRQQRRRTVYPGRYPRRTASVPLARGGLNLRGAV
jgi:hypothetical protein